MTRMPRETSNHHPYIQKMKAPCPESRLIDARINIFHAPNPNSLDFHSISLKLRPQDLYDDASRAAHLNTGDNSDMTPRGRIFFAILEVLRSSHIDPGGGTAANHTYDKLPDIGAGLPRTMNLLGLGSNHASLCRSLRPRVFAPPSLNLSCSKTPMYS